MLFSIRVYFLILFGIFFTGSRLGAQSDLITVADSIYFSDPDSSFVLCCEAEKKALFDKNSVQHAKSLLCKGRYFLLKTRYDEADQALTSAMNIFIAASDLSGQAATLKLRAILYGRLNNAEAETKALKDAIDLYEKAEDHTGLIRTLFNFSLDAIRRNDFESADWALEKLSSLESWMEDTDHYFLFQNHGLAEIARGNFDEAISWLEQAKSVAEENNMNDSYATVTMLLGKANYKSGKTEAGRKWLLESLRFTRQKNLDFERSETLQELVALHRSAGDYRNAFEYLNEMMGLHDTLYNLERINRINELEKKVLIEEKQKELANADINLAGEKLKSANARSQVLILLLVVAIVILIAGFVILMFLRTKSLKDKITTQANEIRLRHEEVSEAYRNITDSIRYAKRIQDAILPPNRLVKEYLQNSFILYKPKDIVAGDFYWMESYTHFGASDSEGFKKEGASELGVVNGQSVVLFAVCDCTGHGVPGAMVSVLGYNAMNRAFREFGLRMPNEILDKVNELVEETFSKSEDEVADGMDAALCALDQKNRMLYYAGANNPLWIVRDKQLLEFAPDKQPIGRFDHKQAFHLHSIQLQKGDCVYVFSDGFADQFGGSSGKKMKYSRFKELLLSGCDFSMEEQRQRLNVEFEKWKGEMEQVDDVCVIGVRI